jgi:catechol 2,3-dioxygenase-like lactoylglutathione lyase family enzyme
MTGLSHVGLKSTDLRRTERFYVDVLGGQVLRRRQEPDHRIWLEVRGVRFEIAEVASRPALSNQDRAFLPTTSFLVTPDEMDEVVLRLREADIPHREPMLKATGSSVGAYFADPDGNPLSLSCPDGYQREGLARSHHNTWVPSPFDWTG